MHKNYSIEDISVEFKDSMGDDVDVVNDARISHDKETKFISRESCLDAYDRLDSNKKISLVKPTDDEDYMKYVADRAMKKEDTVLHHADFRLIGFLMRGNNHHWSPFAHSFMKFKIKAPIFVARQLVKHQVGLAWNEVSRRYVDDGFEYHVPGKWRGRPKGSIKQGSDSNADLPQQLLTEKLITHMSNAQDLYDEFLELGVAPEQARIVHLQNMHVDWVWTGSVYAWARVANLRIYPDAQPETQEVAKAIYSHGIEKFPVAWGALTQLVKEFVEE